MGLSAVSSDVVGMSKSCLCCSAVSAMLQGGEGGGGGGDGGGVQTFSNAPPTSSGTRDGWMWVGGWAWVSGGEGRRVEWEDL